MNTLEQEVRRLRSEVDSREGAKRSLQLRIATLYAASLMAFDNSMVVRRGSSMSPMSRVARDEKRKRAKAQRQARKRNR